MNGIRRSTAAALASLVFFCAWSGGAWSDTAARGARMQTLPMRALAASSAVIVVAEPIEPRPPRLAHRYRVLDVVRGAGIDAGEEIKLNEDALGVYTFGGGMLWVRPGNQNAPPPKPANDTSIKKALLFLNYADTDSYTNHIEKPDEFQLSASGIRMLVGEQVFVPMQFNNPGPYDFIAEEKVTWDRMLTEVRESLREVEGVQAINRVQDAAQRNRLLFRWIARHEADLEVPRTVNRAFSHFYGSEKSWGRLDYDVFDWIMQSGVPEDCWQAMRLAERLNRSVHMERAMFASAKGRSFLLDKALDEKLPASDRDEAVALLQRDDTSWLAIHRGDIPLDPQKMIGFHEQDTYWRRLEPVLDDPRPERRITALKIVAAISVPHRHSNNRHVMFGPGPDTGTLQAAVPRLAKMFLEEDDPKVRTAMFAALKRIETQGTVSYDERYPNGVQSVLLVHPVMGGDPRVEWLIRSPVPITSVPTIQYRGIAGQQTFPTQELKPELDWPRDVPAEGWTRASVTFKLPASLFTPAAKSAYGGGPREWEIRAHGTFGRDAIPWQSETTTFALPQWP